ncbi:hypothetical protein WN51_01379 [Melipona quadrifasciata]|uniref:Uncharacterized protein n=1 Tax=Melipona quadrifasciata TaxID=166423 RepID=A0A0N0BF93_9HYME|nr:hypothetical protein WN51_01379 [Melipona quadrifasciata]
MERNWTDKDQRRISPAEGEAVEKFYYLYNRDKCKVEIRNKMSLYSMVEE